MSLLPQRKKSPAEIAQLREGLGIAATPAPPDFAPTSAPPEPPPAELAETAELVAVVNIEAAAPPAVEAANDLADGEEITLLPVSGPKGRTRPVHPLAAARESHATTAGDSNIPQQRRSSEEILAIRQREIFSVPPPPLDPTRIPASPVCWAPGYAAVLGGCVGFVDEQVPWQAPAASLVVALVIATLIAWRRPCSTHHAAIIAMMAFLILVFGALHYFPQPRVLSW